MKKTPVNKEKLLKLLEDGKNILEISKILHHNSSVLYSYCKRNNITYPKTLKGLTSIKDISGNKYGSLLVISQDLKRPRGGGAYWNCVCDCGKECVYFGSDLRAGKSKTCGCRMSVVCKRNWQGYGEISKVYWSSVYRGAIQRGLEFTITIEEADSLLIKQDFKCALSGKTIFVKDKTASIDRINSLQGYTIENIQWVHKSINKLKNIFSNEELIQMCTEVYLHNQSSNKRL